MIKILICDDHPLVRQGLCRLIAENIHSSRCLEVSSGQECINKISEDKFNLLILDITMPGINGIDILKRIKQCKIKIPVLVLSYNSDEYYIHKVLSLGAKGYVTKDQGMEVILLAIKTLLAGKEFIPTSIADKTLPYLITKSYDFSNLKISDREYQVMVRIAKGKKASEISKELNISPSTVSTYRRRLLDKLGLSTNADLYQYVVNNKHI